MRAWLKSLHYAPGWTIAPGERSWISDAGRRKKGARVYRRDGQPWGQPRWAVGDRVALYISGSYKIPLLVEVTAAPVFDPDRVQQEDRFAQTRPDVGERWPWLTEVLGVAQRDLSSAPTLNDVGLSNRYVMRRTRGKLDWAIHDRIERLLA